MHTGLAVITGTEDRQHAYVALTRGTDVNTAYVFTAVPEARRPGPRPAPGPRARPLRPPHRRTRRPAHPSGGNGGRPSPCCPACWNATASSCPPPRPGTRPCPTPTTWPSCTRSGPPRPPPPASSATRTCSLHALPPGYRSQPSHQAKWLWRTLRAAELAGLDAGQVLAAAIGERDLAGARDIPAVIDARLRHRIGSLVPLPPGPWSAQLPAIADPERRAYAAQIAALMDARKDRIGEHAAEHALPWAVTALGPVPGAPAGPAGLAAAGQLHRRLARAVRLRPPHRADRPRTRRGRPGHPRRLARGLRRPRPRRRPRRARHARRHAAAPARHLPHRNRLGPAVGRRRAPPGPRRRLARPPGRPSAPPPKPTPPSSTATTTKPPRSTRWPPATRPCTTPTANARPSSPPSWPTAPTGSRPPASNATWPSPPTPNYAAATPASSSPRCAPPNPSPPPRPSATSSP